MTDSIALLGLPDSPLAPRLAGLLADRGQAPLSLALDAPLDGEAVTMRGDRVTWQDCELTAAAAIWIERPVFPWPQMLPAPCPLPDVANFERWRTYQREARALGAAALAVAADHVPTLNPPATGHLSVTPTVALDRLAAAGLPVQPWRVGTEPAATDLVQDATGHDRWHPAGLLPADAPRLILAPVAGPVTDLLVIGAAVAGARSWPDGAAWMAAASAPQVADASADMAGSAGRAAAALALEMVQVTCARGPDGPVLLAADAAPRLAAWDILLDGAVGTALADRLADLAAGTRGDTP